MQDDQNTPNPSQDSPAQQPAPSEVIQPTQAGPAASQPAPTTTPVTAQVPEQQSVTNPQPTEQIHTTAPAAQPTATPAAFSAATVPNHAPKSKKKLVVGLVALIVVILAAGGALYAMKHSHGSSATATTTTTCQATTGTLTASTAEQAYDNFVKAIKANSQECVDQLSTTVFHAVQNQTFGASDGNWLTKKTSLPSALDDFRKLPTQLDSSSFSSVDYVRPDYSAFKGLENAGQPTGIEIKYKVANSGHGYSLNLDLAFVGQNGKILVDELKAAPTQIDNQ